MKNLSSMGSYLVNGMIDYLDVKNRVMFGSSLAQILDIFQDLGCPFDFSAAAA